MYSWLACGGGSAERADFGVPSDRGSLSSSSTDGKGRSARAVWTPIEQARSAIAHPADLVQIQLSFHHKPPIRS